MLDLGYFDVLFIIEGTECRINNVAFGEYFVQPSLTKVRVNMPDTLYSEVDNTIGIYVDNRSGEVISNVCFNSYFTSFIDAILPAYASRKSGYTSLVVKPVNSGKINFGNLNYSFEVNEVVLQEETIDLGTHEIA